MKRLLNKRKHKFVRRIIDKTAGPEGSNVICKVWEGNIVVFDNIPFTFVVAKIEDGLWYVYELSSGFIVTDRAAHTEFDALLYAEERLMEHRDTMYQVMDDIVQYNVPYSEYYYLPVGTNFRKEKINK